MAKQKPQSAPTVGYWLEGWVGMTLYERTGSYVVCRGCLRARLNSREHAHALPQTAADLQQRFAALGAERWGKSNTCGYCHMTLWSPEPEAAVQEPTS